MIKVLEIDRSKWACGDYPSGYEEPCLLNGTGMCCLGFYARQAGYKAGEIREMGMPADLADHGYNQDIFAKAKARFGGLLTKRGNDSQAANRLAKINDNPRLTPKIREHKVKQEFAKLGVKVIFKGHYRKWWLKVNRKSP